MLAMWRKAFDKLGLICSSPAEQPVRHHTPKKILTGLKNIIEVWIDTEVALRIFIFVLKGL